MTPEMTELAIRAVSCEGWRWMPGMMIHTGFRCVWVDDETFRSFEQNGNEMYGSTDCLLPDLTDHATLGCLLALVREAWGDSKTCARPDLEDDIWYVVTRSGLAFAASEAEALVAALEAAP